MLHALRQRHLNPAFAAIPSAEYLAISRSDINLLGVAGMQADRHQRAVRRHLVETLPRLAVFLYAFDLIELNGQDLRREPLELRKRELGKLLRWAVAIGLQFNEHIAEPGDVVFRHACKMGLEGIVSKRLGSRYRSGRSPDWLKFKNPEAPAVKREAEEDWG